MNAWRGVSVRRDDFLWYIQVPVVYGTSSAAAVLINARVVEDC